MRLSLSAADTRLYRVGKQIDIPWDLCIVREYWESMADLDTSNSIEGSRDEGGTASVLKKKYRVSELPLSSSQKSTIDGLVHTIKKKGIYDTLRKQVWAQYSDGVSQ